MEQQNKKAIQEKHISNAIKSWTNKKNRIYKWYECERHSPEYCQEQIEYFKNLKLI
jgi:hypothetical protein